MKQAYVSLYKKEGVENFIRTLEENGWEILSSYSTFEYLIKKGIRTTEVKPTEIHPTLIVISSLTSLKKSKPLSNIKLVIADIPDTLPDEVYNLLLIITSLKKNITVIFPDECVKYIEHIKIYGEITENLKKELNLKKMSLLSYLLSSQIYSSFPYINERDDILTIPLKKAKEMIGENPHQKAFLYQTPFRKDFELIKGNLNTNHFFDIQKAAEIISEIDLPFIMILNHSNIVAFLWEKDYLEKLEIARSKTIVLNFTVNTKTLQKISQVNPQMIIAPDYDVEALSLVEKLGIKNLIKITHRIKPPKEMDIFFICGYAIIQYKDIEEIKANSVNNIKISPHILEKIKAGLSLVKHLKTFSSLAFYGKTLRGLSQANSSTSLALKRTFDEIELTAKTFEITQTADSFTIITDGFINYDIIPYLSKYSVDAIVSQGFDETSIKKLSEKNIILIATEKRHYRHI